MPNDERGTLRIESDGGWSVGDVIGLLNGVDAAYRGILMFETVLDLQADEYRRRRESFPFADGFYGPSSLVLAVTGLSATALQLWIRPQDELIVARIELSSPGFWEFLGSLSPLEVLRRYLDDRHRRRQDREYREPEERRRLELENLVLENQVIRERISLARELGLGTESLTPLMNRFLYEPLRGLDLLQDRGVIRAKAPEIDT